METFSFSRLSTVESCLRRFYYKYVLGLEDPVGLPAIFGKTVHKAIELCMNGRSFEEAVTTAWIEEADMSVQVERAEVERQVRIALNYSFSGIIEKHFKMKLAEGVILQGYIDLAMTHTPAVVVDWKTGRIGYEVLANWQIPLYAAHIMEETGQNKVLGVLAFLRLGQLSKAVITKEIADKAKDWAIKTAREAQSRLEIIPLLSEEEILNKAFPPKPSWLCGYCPWSYQCLQSKKNEEVNNHAN